jgi:predicted metal-dependent phosphoesterase TrpH
MEARRRGMDLVTLTDHDTIEGALEIAALPNTFVSEEVTCTLPSGRRLHLGVFDLTERHHERIARLRNDAEALFAYLDEQRLPACINHPFSALTGRRETPDLHLAVARLPLVEARNGMMSASLNALATTVARGAGRGLVGGSDAHTLASVARAFTMVPSARSRGEFLAGLRRGLTMPAGHSGGYRPMTADVSRILASAYAAAARDVGQGGSDLVRLLGLLAVLPLVPLLPLVTATVFGREQLFARRQFLQYQAWLPARRAWTTSGPFGPTSAASPAV